MIGAIYEKYKFDWSCMVTDQTLLYEQRIVEESVT